MRTYIDNRRDYAPHLHTHQQVNGEYMRTRHYDDFLGWQDWRDWLSLNDYQQCELTGLYGDDQSVQAFPLLDGAVLIIDVEVHAQWLAECMQGIDGQTPRGRRWRLYTRESEHGTVWGIEKGSRKTVMEFSDSAVTGLSAFENCWNYLWRRAMGNNNGVYSVEQGA